MRELSFGARISDSFLKKLKWETAKATDESPDVLPCLCEEERQRHQSFDCNEGQSKRIDIVMVALSREEAGTDRTGTRRCSEREPADSLRDNRTSSAAGSRR